MSTPKTKIEVWHPKGWRNSKYKTWAAVQKEYTILKVTCNGEVQAQKGNYFDCFREVKK